jgi:signal transduction histidine kinase
MDDFARGLLRLLREPFSHRGRLQRWYAAFSFVLAVPAFAFTIAAVVVGLGMSLSFAGMLIGLPLLALTLLMARKLGGLCRRMANRMLDSRVGPPPPLPPQSGVTRRIRASLTDQAGWRACAYLVLKLPFATIGYLLASAFVVYGLPYSTFPIWWEVVHQFAVHGYVIHFGAWISWWKQDPLLVAGSVRTLAGSFSLIPVGIVVFFATPYLIRGVNAIDSALIVNLLGPPLPQRVRDLELARAQAVDDSAARLRRIERDLHDGAQAQMVAVAMKLGLAREKLGVAAGGVAVEADLERALELVDAAHRSAKAAIIELRDLARGIHPPVLDHGLGTALQTLAASSAVPVDLVVDLAERPSPAIETIAYFCAAELLANVAKHSGARRASLEAVHVPGMLRIRVGDDGAGGARVVAGGGLAGLTDRLRTVDGTMEISSQPGGPTVITVELPSHA